jgi:ubiquitin-protein ligase
MSSVRERRLWTDFERLQALIARSTGRIGILSCRGEPPDEYVIGFKSRSITRLERSGPVYGDHHRVWIKLPPNYPGLQGRPMARFITQISHPHVYTNLEVCMGNRHVVSEFLDAFVMRIAEIIRYSPEYIDARSVANGEAMKWVRVNWQALPLDKPYMAKVTAEEVQPRLEKEAEPADVSWRNL